MGQVTTNVSASASAQIVYQENPGIKFVEPRIFGNAMVKVYSFPGSDTFTVPAGVSKIRVRVVGAGGGGAKANSSAPVVATGGGGGGYAVGVFSVTPGTQYTVTVGAGGAGQPNTDTNGNPGGSTSFGALISATGGSGGIFGVGAGAGGGASSVAAAATRRTAERVFCSSS